MRYNSAPDGVRPFPDSRISLVHNEESPRQVPGNHGAWALQRGRRRTFADVARVEVEPVLTTYDGAGHIDVAIEVALGLLINAANVADQNGGGDDARVAIGRRIGEALAVLRLPGADDLRAMGSPR